MVGDELAEVVRVTTLPTEGFQQHGNTGLVFDHPVQQHLVEVRALVPTVAAGDVDDVLLRLLVTVIPPIAMAARPIALGACWGQASALGRRGGPEAVEFGHPLGVERLQGTAERIIVAMTGWNARSDEARERHMLKKMRPEVELLGAEAQAVEAQRLDRMAGGDNPQFRGLLGGLINDLRDAEFFKHARDQTRVI